MYISIIPSILRRRNHATTKETICKDCEKLKNKIAFWRDLAGRYKASIDALYGRLGEARVARAERTKPVHNSRILTKRTLPEIRGLLREACLVVGLNDEHHEISMRLWRRGIRSNRSSNHKRHLLLRQLSGSRARIRTASRRAAGARTGRRHSHGFVSEGSRPLHPRPRTSQGISPQARIANPPPRRHMLQFGNVSRLHEGTLVVDVPGSVSDGRAKNRDAGYDTRPARKRHSSCRCTKLSRPLRQIYHETISGLDRNGIPIAKI